MVMNKIKRVWWSYVYPTIDFDAPWLGNTDTKVLFLFERRICTIDNVNVFPFVTAYLAKFWCGIAVYMCYHVRYCGICSPLTPPSMITLTPTSYNYLNWRKSLKLHLGCQQSWPIGLHENSNTFEKVCCRMYNYYKMKKTTWIKLSQLQPRDVTFWTSVLKKACVSWEVCYSVWMEAKNINDSCIFDLQWPGMLLQSAAIVAKKLLWVEDKITALSKKYVSWVLYARF